MTLIGAVLGAPSESARDASALSLLEWGYQNFGLRTPVKAGQVIARRPVRGRPGLHVDLIAAGTFAHVFARSTSIQALVEAPPKLAGPRPARQVVGAVVVRVGGTQLARIPLLLARAVPAAPKSLSAELIAGPFTLIVLVLLLGSGILVLRRRRSGALGGGRRTA
jgi:D-alanyl-D-alanine carboxypeptidase